MSDGTVSTTFFCGFRTTDAAQSRCFELLGFDIILDETLRPWLLEVNHSPSFNVDSPLDHRVKTGVLGDLLKALRLQPRDRRAWMAEERRRQKARLYTPQVNTMSVRGKKGLLNRTTFTPAFWRLHWYTFHRSPPVKTRHIHIHTQLTHNP